MKLSNGFGVFAPEASGEKKYLHQCQYLCVASVYSISSIGDGVTMTRLHNHSKMRRISTLFIFRRNQPGEGRGETVLLPQPFAVAGA